MVHLAHWGGPMATLVCCLGLAVSLRGVYLGELCPSVRLRVIDFRRRLQTDLRFIRSEQSPNRVLVLMGASLTCSLLLLAAGVYEGAALSLLSLVQPFFLAQQRQRRVSLLERQVEGWIESLARALEAAPSLREALAATTGACAQPMRAEVELVVQEMDLGRSLEQALLAWETRVNSRVLSLALSTLQIGRQTGGSLPQVLKEAAGALREMERLEGVVRTKTAEAKAQSFLIGVLPVPLYFAMNWSDPTHFDPLKETSTGHLLVAIAVVLWLAALFSVKKILAVRI